MAATLVAIAISWLGVTKVLSAGAFDSSPPALSVDPPATSAPSGTPGFSGSAPATTSAVTTTSRPPTAPRTPRSTATEPSSTPASDTEGNVRGYQLDGGRVVVDLGPTSARLVSAIPEPGWQAQTWQAEGWIRVDFTNGASTSSCFITWNGHPPTVQTT
jgi:hypothetical protein